MESDGVYYLYSKFTGDLSVGVTQEPVGEQAKPSNGHPIQLTADLVEWVTTPKIAGSGPTRLGVGPYKYTGEYDGELAIATNDEDRSRDWYLVPSDDEQYYLIIANPRSDLVWTVGEKHEIKIAPYTGGDNQLFTFKPKPAINESESTMAK